MWLVDKGQVFAASIATPRILTDDGKTVEVKTAVDNSGTAGARTVIRQTVRQLVAERGGHTIHAHVVSGLLRGEDCRPLKALRSNPSSVFVPQPPSPLEAVSELKPENGTRAKESIFDH